MPVLGIPNLFQWSQWENWNLRVGLAGKSQEPRFLQEDILENRCPVVSHLRLSWSRSLLSTKNLHLSALARPVAAAAESDFYPSIVLSRSKEVQYAPISLDS